MATEILMPALSPTMTEGTLARWLKAEGDAIAPGDVLAEIETDKATMEIEAVDDGVLGKIMVAEGSEGIPVNTPIAVILAEGEDAAAVPEPAPAPAAPQAAPQTAPEPAAAPQAAAAIIPAAPDYNGPLTTITQREALRDAIAEEMRTDETIFLMGEEVAQYEGAYKVSQGLLEEFGDKRVVDTPITEHGFTGLGVGAA
ncbi:MAG: pyruvate dehydrogenase complex E1 component subunit beta, partial [Rhodospirillaceae bacterium]|nr:pyruvate dehydrogenase complex E1 component subunit beta [Rhodospirillaceae bacterium]